MISKNGINIPELEDDIIPCKLCGTTSNQSLVRVRDLCERCFVRQFVEPLKKEERNLNEALAVIRNNILTFLHELGEAKRVEQTYQMRLNQVKKTLLCVKCRTFKTDSTVKLLAHETACTDYSPLNGKSGRPRTATPRAPKTVVPTVSDADELFN